MSRALRLATAVLATALAIPAAAFVRSSDRTTGKTLFWPMPVVAYHVSDASASQSQSCATTPSGSPALDAARSAFSAWNAAGANLELLYAGALGDASTGVDGTRENLVVFRQGFCSANRDATACIAAGGTDCGNRFNCFEDNGTLDRSIVALTSVLYEPSTGRIVSADIEVNGWNGVAGDLPASGPQNGWYFTCDLRPPDFPRCTRYGETGCYFIDLQNTLTHEAGHFVGLAHPCGDQGEPSCSASPDFAQTTMFPQTTPGDVGKRTLSPDDVAGIRTIYPDPGGCACGSGGTGGAIAALLTVLALRPRRSARPR